MYLKHSVAAASVHLSTAALVEQKLSVQRVDMAALAMHVVAIVQDAMAEGSQQPCTPFRVLVAQTEFDPHVREEAMKDLD